MSIRWSPKHLLSLLLFLSLSSVYFTSAVANNDPPIRITIEGSFTGGGSNVLCAGPSCRMLVNMLRSEDYVVEDTLVDDDRPINHTKFCAKLKQQRPANCGNIVPATPIFPNGVFGVSPYTPNGCGSTSWQMMLMNTAVGNRNEPVPGFNFENVCNAHDWCYGTGGRRDMCDTGFGIALDNVTDESGNPCQTDTTCARFADLYQAAVTQFGQTAYNAAQAQNQCAMWHFNMLANQCPR